MFLIFQPIRFQSIVAVTAGGVLGKSRQIWVGRSPLYRYARSQKRVSALTGSIRPNVEIAVIQTSAMGRLRTSRNNGTRRPVWPPVLESCNASRRLPALQAVTAPVSVEVSGRYCGHVSCCLQLYLLGLFGPFFQSISLRARSLESCALPPGAVGLLGDGLVTRNLGHAVWTWSLASNTRPIFSFSVSVSASSALSSRSADHHLPIVEVRKKELAAFLILV